VCDNSDRETIIGKTIFPDYREISAFKRKRELGYVSDMKWRIECRGPAGMGEKRKYKYD
jgi:hypothetical protein